MEENQAVVIEVARGQVPGRVFARRVDGKKLDRAEWEEIRLAVWEFQEQKTKEGFWWQ